MHEDYSSLNNLRLIKTIKIIRTAVFVSLLSIITSSKLVFSRWPYLVLGGAVTILFWIIFNVFDQLLFFSPVMTFYLPDDAVQGFIISDITVHSCGCGNKHESVCHKTFKGLEDRYPITVFGFNYESSSLALVQAVLRLDFFLYRLLAD